MGEAMVPEAFLVVSVATLFCKLKEIWGNGETLCILLADTGLTVVRGNGDGALSEKLSFRQRH